jgi:hypothetical protein
MGVEMEIDDYRTAFETWHIKRYGSMPPESCYRWEAWQAACHLYHEVGLESLMPLTDVQFAERQMESTKQGTSQPDDLPIIADGMIQEWETGEDKTVPIYIAYRLAQAVLRQPERESGWVSVEDRLPENEQQVLVWRDLSKSRPGATAQVYDIETFRTETACLNPRWGICDITSAPLRRNSLDAVATAI